MSKKKIIEGCVKCKGKGKLIAKKIPIYNICDRCNGKGTVEYTRNISDDIILPGNCNKNCSYDNIKILINEIQDICKRDGLIFNYSIDDNK